MPVTPTRPTLAPMLVALPCRSCPGWAVDLLALPGLALLPDRIRLGYGIQWDPVGRRRPARWAAVRAAGRGVMPAAGASMPQARAAERRVRGAERRMRLRPDPRPSGASAGPGCAAARPLPYADHPRGAQCPCPTDLSAPRRRHRPRRRDADRQRPPHLLAEPRRRRERRRARSPTSTPAGFDVRIAAEVKDFDPTVAMDRKMARRMSRFIHLGDGRRQGGRRATRASTSPTGAPSSATAWPSR